MKRTAFLALLLVTACLISPSFALATTEYAGQTGLACGQCHLSPGGGGDLTEGGLAFRDELRIKGLYRPLTATQRVVRFIVGLIHTFTAVIWFGTILYVHIILKPAYAAGGLPKGELRLGWVSIPVMAVSGALLAIARVPSFGMLFSTRFGILLTVKVILFLIMMASAFIVTAFIGPRMRRKIGPGIPDLCAKRDMTREELALFDGKEGRPAYFAFEGTIYNASESKLWRDGAHLKKHSAGGDLTDALKGAPHGPEKVKALPVTGKLVQLPAGMKRPFHVRLFYFFAYMNLVLVFLIIFVISLWRWW
jgi:predicted heme/steroid binding protein